MHKVEGEASMRCSHHVEVIRGGTLSVAILKKVGLRRW